LLSFFESVHRPYHSGTDEAMRFSKCNKTFGLTCSDIYESLVLFDPVPEFLESDIFEMIFVELIPGNLLRPGTEISADVFAGRLTRLTPRGTNAQLRRTHVRCDPATIYKLLAYLTYEKYSFYVVKVCGAVNVLRRIHIFCYVTFFLLNRLIHL